MQTISLNDLLEKPYAPAKIDYLSIDTEGSEFDILSIFEFGKHEFKGHHLRAQFHADTL